MKYKLILIVAIIGMISGSCKPPRTDKPETLSVTIEPQKYFLSTLAGNHFDINCVVPGGSNPESADFTPSQMMALDKSAAYFKIGYLSIENILIDKVSEGNTNLLIIDCSEGITPIGDAHTHCNETGHSHDHSHHAHAGGDPHTWSSVKSAKIIAENMYRGLLQIDKANEAHYTKNYNTLIAEFNHTDSIIRSYLDKAPSKSFIIYHPALSYFADEYGLTQYSIEHEGKNPSPSQLKELIDKAKTEGIKTIFIQREFDTKNAETIAEAIGGKTVPINLLSFHWSEEMIKIAKALALQHE